MFIPWIFIYVSLVVLLTVPIYLDFHTLTFFITPLYYCVCILIGWYPSGHCSEKDHEPPRGLQLILGTESRPHLVDTLVMANLGYWQMKVSPGIWYLQLAPGRSSELYSVKGDENGNEDSSSLLRITINDLRGKVVYLDVMKKKGKEHEKLLVSTDDDESSHETKVRSCQINFYVLSITFAVFMCV